MPFSGIGTQATHNPNLAALDACLSGIVDAGFSHAELACPDWGIWLGGAINVPQLRRLVKLTDRFRGRLRYTVHGPIAFHLMSQDDWDGRARLLRAGLEATRELGAEVMVYESGWIQEWPAGGSTNMLDFMARERELLREVGEGCLVWKGKIAIETMAGAEYMRSYTDWPHQLVNQITLTNHPAVGVCIDTGHSNIGASRGGFDFLGGIRQLAPHVFTFHLHDNFGTWASPHLGLNHKSPESWALGLGDLHLPIGWGTIPFEKMLREIVFPHSPILMAEINWDLYAHLMPELHQQLYTWSLLTAENKLPN